MSKSPCKECSDRKMKCHADCERYKEYVDTHIKENEFLTEKNKRRIYVDSRLNNPPKHKIFKSHRR